MNRRLTAAALVTAALLTNAGFAALGSIFDYPAVLKEPSGVVLQRFREHPSALSLWFAVLAASAALFGPIAAGIGRLRADRRMRMSVPVGMAAAIVQAVGLSRWPLLVPGLAEGAGGANPALAAEAESRFRAANLLLGTVIGETLGYALTAVWTVLVVTSLGRRFAGRVFARLGAVAAVMIFAGVFSPLDVPFIDGLNFSGYVLWSVWLVWLAIALLREGPPAAARHGEAL